MKQLNLFGGEDEPKRYPRRHGVIVVPPRPKPPPNDLCRWCRKEMSLQPYRKPWRRRYEFWRYKDYCSFACWDDARWKAP